MALAPPTRLAAVAKSSLLPPPRVTTTALPSAVTGQPYSASLSATGGIPPYTWSLNDGQLPAGLVLNPNGTITGTPNKSGKVDFDVLCTDSRK